MADGVTVDGRALARNGEVTLINDTITRSTCSAPFPTASPGASTGATAKPGPATTPPPTDTPETSKVPASGSTLVLLVGAFALALVFAVVATRRSLRAIRAR